jgi:phosphohistidine swiveling domain-containing protein
VSAVVTETGGVLSHAAIVAREHGIPAVLAVPDAMTTLRDGETVTVDGGAGRVTG